MNLNSPTDSKNNLNTPLSFMVCSKSTSQCVMDAFIYLLHMRSQWLTGKKITCQFPERTDVDKQTRLVFKWEQLELIGPDLEGFLLLQLKFLFIPFFSEQFNQVYQEKIYSNKHLFHFYDTVDTVMGVLYMIKHFFLTKEHQVGTILMSQFCI